MQQLILTEARRVYDALTGLDPLSEEYDRGLAHLSQLLWLSGDVHQVAAVPAAETRAQEPVEGVAKAVAEDAEPDPEPEPETESETGKSAEELKAFRIETREALAEAKLKGVNIADIIKKFGVNKFSSVPDDRLPELRADLKKALEELG